MHWTIKAAGLIGIAMLLGTGTVPLWADVSPAASTAAPPAPVQAAPPQTPNASVAARISTLGLGLEGSYLVTPNVAARLSYNTYSYSHSASSQGLDYDGKLKLNSVSALADFYPSMHGGFHLTAGFLINNNKLTAHGKPSAPGGAQTFTLNGNSYNVSDVGAVDGSVTFSKFSPYLGLGFGKPSEGGSALRFLFDLGVVFQGKPSLSLTRSGGTSNPALSSLINADLNAQRDKTQSDVNKFQYYPVISFGLAYHF